MTGIRCKGTLAAALALLVGSGLLAMVPAAASPRVALGPAALPAGATAVVVRVGNVSRTVSPGGTVADALVRAGVRPAAGMRIFPDLGAALSPGLQVYVALPGDSRAPLFAPPRASGFVLDLGTGRRSIGLVLNDGGALRYRRVLASTVGDALRMAGITLGPLDTVDPAPGTKLTDGMHITITRIATQVITVEVSVPYAVDDVSNPDAYRGTDSLLQQGQDGLDEVVEEVVYQNGVEVERHELERHRLRDPIDRVVSVGTKLPPNALPADPDYFFSVMYHMYATAYSAPGGYTASGRPAEYGAVAVDPNVISLGTHLYVEGYGFAYAADTGSAIRGMRIDLCFNTYQESVDYGAAHVRVWVLTS